jgi:hypothetical protein
MDQPSPLPAVSAVRDASAIESGDAYDHLCEWFDRELEILVQKFGDFSTVSSLKSR